MDMDTSCDHSFVLAKVEKVLMREYVVSGIEYKEAKKRIVTLGFRAGLGVRVEQSQNVVYAQITGHEHLIDTFIIRVTKKVGCELREIQVNERVTTCSGLYL